MRKRNFMMLLPKNGFHPGTAALEKTLGDQPAEINLSKMIALWEASRSGQIALRQRT
jgi:hypothetical protein